MARWLAGLVSAEVQRLHTELKHVRATRAVVLRSVLDEHTEVLRLRARVEQLENLLLNPNTLKEQS